MPFWKSMYFSDANSPTMEQMIFFHDHTMITITVIISLISYLMINMSISKFSNRFFLENHSIEAIWTMLPAIMLVFIALPSLRLLYLMEENFTPSITLKIMGHQWYWSYELSDFNIDFDSFMIPSNDLNNWNFRLLDVDNSVLLPYNSFIRLLVSSTDVIHSWTVPSLGLKMDAIPGRLNQMNFYSYRPGMYFGQCSEICGANHSFMPISLELVSTSTFLKWIKNFK